MPAPDASPWLTVKEAAAVAKVGVKLIYRAIRTGRLRAAKISARHDYRIHCDWIDQWLVESSQPVEIRIFREARR